MALNKVGIAVVATAAAGALAVGGATLANAATVPGTPTKASTAVAEDTSPQTPGRGDRDGGVPARATRSTPR